MSRSSLGSVYTTWKYGTGNSSASRSASHRREAAAWHFGQCRLRQELYAISVWPHAAFSQRATCPRPPERVEPRAAALLRRPLLSVSLCLPVARRAQARQRALDLGDYSCRHAGVASRRVEFGVPEQRLNQPNVLAVLKQMGGEGMTQRVKGDRLAQPRGVRRLLEQPAELARRRRLTIPATGKHPALFPRNAGVTPGRPR